MLTWNIHKLIMNNEHAFQIRFIVNVKPKAHNTYPVDILRFLIFRQVKKGEVIVHSEHQRTFVRRVLLRSRNLINENIFIALSFI